MNLADTTLLLTRPEPAALRFAAEAEAALGTFGAVIVSPLMRIAPLGTVLPVSRETEFAFTSANGIGAVRAQISGDHRAWCVGERTAAEARSAGFEVAGVAPDVLALTDLIIRERPRGPVLHAAGRHRRGALTEQLRLAGIPATMAAVYDQIPLPLSDEARTALQSDGDVVVPLFSPRSARLLATQAATRRARLHIVGISAATSAEWQPRPSEQVVSALSPDAGGVLAAMVRLFDAARSA